MSKTKEWIIGADPGCDIVVDSPSVSSRHCRLIRDAEGYVVEDLESTNGTLLNGVRLTARKRVSRTDKITLGQTMPMPWPDRKRKKTTRTISIGRFPENDVVIDDPVVSGHHAEITVTDDRATIKDLNSSNGTAIGSVGRKVQSAPVEATDTIFFGTLAFRAEDLLEPGNSVAPVEATMPVSALPADVLAGIAGTSRPARPRWFLPAVIGGPALLTIAIITVIVAGSGKETSPQKSGNGAATKTKKRNVVDPKNAIYWILVKDPEGGTSFRIGTAVAIGERHLLTTASIIKAVESLDQELPNAVAFCPETEKQSPLEFGRSKMHPKFEAADRAARAANRLYEQAAEKMQRLVAEIQKMEREPDAAKSDAAAKQRLADLRRQIKAIGDQLTERITEVVRESERVTCFDLGVLELTRTASPLLGHLDVAVASGSRHSGDAVTIWGSPFPVEEPLLTSYSGHRSQKLGGRIRMLKRLDPKVADPFRLVVKSEQNVADSQWVGAAVLDSDNRLIGVFSRLTPSNGDKPPRGDLFDVPLATRLRDFFPISVTSPESKKD